MRDELVSRRGFFCELQVVLRSSLGRRRFPPRPRNASAPVALGAGYASLSPAEAAFVEALVNVMCPADELTKCTIPRRAHRLAQLRLVAIGLGAFPIPENLAVSRVRESFKDDGTPNDPAYEKRATSFLDELLWFTEAIADRKAKETKVSR